MDGYASEITVLSIIITLLFGLYTQFTVTSFVNGYKKSFTIAYLNPIKDLARVALAESYRTESIIKTGEQKKVIVQIQERAAQQYENLIKRDEFLWRLLIILLKSFYIFAISIAIIILFKYVFLIIEYAKFVVLCEVLISAITFFPSLGGTLFGYPEEGYLIFFSLIFCAFAFLKHRVHVMCSLTYKTINNDLNELNKTRIYRTIQLSKKCTDCSQYKPS